jgi:hypothetical protein
MPFLSLDPEPHDLTDVEIEGCALVVVPNPYLIYRVTCCGLVQSKKKWIRQREGRKKKKNSQSRTVQQMVWWHQDIAKEFYAD